MSMYIDVHTDDQSLYIDSVDESQKSGATWDV